MPNYKTVFFTLGMLQIILGIFMIIPIIIQYVYSEFDSSFVIASIITLVFGILFVISNLDYDKKNNTPNIIVTTPELINAESISL